MKYAALFPGQGSQEVGMGAALFDEWPHLLGEAADDVLGWSLREACLMGPLDRLTQTDVAQPALYALSYAAWAGWRRSVDTPPTAAAGHSLGEYTALAAAGALDYFDGLALVAARGRAMAEASAAVDSGMAAVMGAEPDHLEGICSQRREAGGRLWVANLNAPGQIVVAGADEDIAWLSEQAPDLGLRRVIPLEVAGAFHTPLMEPAVGSLSSALGAVTFAEGEFEVWSNVNARAHTENIADTLVAQLTSPVRFAELLTSMAATGTQSFIHFGPGSVTAGMVKRAVPGAVTAVVADAAGVSSAKSDLFVD